MASKLADLVVNIEARTARLESQLGKAERSFKNSARKMERSFDRVGRGIERATGKFKGLVVAAGAAAAAYITSSFIRDLIQTNKEYESLAGALETVTGSAEKADRQFKKLQEFAATTPFTLDQSITAFIRLQTLGIEPTRERLESFGNTASAFSKDMVQFIEAVADASVFEFERLKEFGIKVRQETDSLQVTFRGNTVKIEKDAQAIVDHLTKIGQTDFAGAMERQMERLPGKLSNLEDAFNKLKFAIGQGGFAGAVGDAAEKMSAFINEFIDSGSAASIGQVLGDAFRVATDAAIALTNAFGQMAAGYRTLKGILTGNVGDLLQMQFDAINGVMGQNQMQVPAVVKSGTSMERQVEQIATGGTKTSEAKQQRGSLLDWVGRLNEAVQRENQYWQDTADQIKSVVDLQGQYKRRVEEVNGAYIRGLITTEDKYKALIIAAKDHNEQLKRMKLLVGDFADGATVAMQDYYDSITNGAQRAYAFFTRTIQSMEDTLTDFFSTGRLDFQSFADGIIRDMNRLLVQRLIMPQFLGGLNAIAPGIEGILQGGPTPSVPGIDRVMPVGAGGNTTINTNMSITTPDADSFRKSQDQVLRELKQKINRVQMKG